MTALLEIPELEEVVEKGVVPRSSFRRYQPPESGTLLVGRNEKTGDITLVLGSKTLVAFLSPKFSLPLSLDLFLNQLQDKTNKLGLRIELAPKTKKELEEIKSEKEKEQVSPVVPKKELSLQAKEAYCLLHQLADKQIEKGVRVVRKALSLLEERFGEKGPELYHELISSGVLIYLKEDLYYLKCQPELLTPWLGLPFEIARLKAELENLKSSLAELKALLETLPAEIRKQIEEVLEQREGLRRQVKGIRNLLNGKRVE